MNSTVHIVKFESDEFYDIAMNSIFVQDITHATSNIIIFIKF